MNRFVLLGSQFDTAGQEWAYVFDSQTGETFKSPVRAVGAQREVAPVFAPAPVAFTPSGFTAPSAVKKVEDPAVKPHPAHGTLTMETPEEREIRLKSRHKVPPAFLGNIDRMGIDPSVHPDAKVDVTTKH